MLVTIGECLKVSVSVYESWLVFMSVYAYW